MELLPSGKPVPNVGNGDVLIAAITSCTNTSNPSVLLAAGLLAKKAVEAGLKVQPHIKTSLAPGSRIVTEYLTETGLMPLPGKAWLRVGRLWLHHLYRQLGSASRPVTPPSARTTWWCRGVVGQPQFRRAHLSS